MNKKSSYMNFIFDDYCDINNILKEEDILSVLPNPDLDCFLDVVKAIIKVLDEEISKAREEMILLSDDLNSKCLVEEKLASLYFKKRICKSLIFENKNNNINKSISRVRK